ncbi:MAG: sigma-70 family RNA polymerase sigma factor [Thermoguttaceae bacterium]|nr:sigma-70 family RNA polymerase sigma factor [Thermoguttaceae bacterium]
MPPRASQSDLPETWSDEELILGYQSEGDRRVFDELVHRYERELYSYLRHYVGDEQVAEDVFQQTFLQVHLKCDQFEPGRKFRPWLYTVAINQAIDMQRRNRRHRMASLDKRLHAGDDEGSGALVDLLDGNGSDPLEAAEEAEQSEEVRRAVDDLPESTRQAVLLVYFQGMKYREAAEVMSIPVGTVKSRLHAAIQKLNEVLSRTHLPK